MRNNVSYIRCNESTFIGKRIRELGCNFICENLFELEAEVAQAYKSLGKSSKSILWELIGYVEFIVKCIVYFIICKLCTIFFVSVKLIKTYVCIHIHICFFSESWLVVKHLLSQNWDHTSSSKVLSGPLLHMLFLGPKDTWGYLFHFCFLSL